MVRNIRLMRRVSTVVSMGHVVGLVDMASRVGFMRRVVAVAGLATSIREDFSVVQVIKGTSNLHSLVVIGSFVARVQVTVRGIVRVVKVIFVRMLACRCIPAHACRLLRTGSGS